MFTITFYEVNNHTWNLDTVFTSYNKASDYLIDRNYIKENGWFKRKSSGWYLDSKAIINKMEVV